MMIVCLYFHLLYPSVYSSHKNIAFVEHIIKLFIVYMLVMVIAPPAHYIYNIYLCILHVSYLHLTYKLLRICDVNNWQML